MFAGALFIPNTITTLSHPLEFVIVFGGAFVGGIFVLQIVKRE
jgi:hypothetical protein